MVEERISKQKNILKKVKEFFTMKKNFLSSLKEKKNVMKLSMVALVGAVTVCGGAALCNVSAMKPNDLGKDDQSVAEVNLGVEVSAKNRAAKLYQAIVDSDNEDKKIEMLEGQFDIIDEVKQMAAEQNESSVLNLVSKVKVTKFCNDHNGWCELDKRKICLHGCNLDDRAITELSNILKDDYFFLSLDLEMNHIGDEGAKCLAEMLKENTTLFDLNLNFNEIGDEGTREIAEMLTRNTTLNKLSLHCNRMNVLGAMPLSRALKVNTALEELDIGYNWTYEPKAIKSILTSLEENTTLKKLTIGGGACDRIGVEVAKYISELLKKNTTLVELDLAETCIGNEGARLISEALLGNTTLRKLNLSVNHIGDEGAKHISDMLKVNTTLFDLCLYYNDIGNDGASKISESLCVNTTLENLSLSCNEIGVEGVDSISKLLKTNSTLKKLWLGRNKIGDEGARMIKEELKTNTTVELYL